MKATALVFLLLCLVPGVVAAEDYSPAAQLEFGVNMAERGLWSEALFRFEGVAKNDPQNARAWNNMAVAYEQFGDFVRAAEYYGKAQEIDPSDPVIAENNRRFKEVLASFEQEAAKTPPPESGMTAPVKQFVRKVKGVSVVRIILPKPTRIDLRGRDSVAVVRFGITARERGSEYVDPARLSDEFQRHMVRILRKKTPLKVSAVPGDVPGGDPEFFRNHPEIWAGIGRAAGADLVVVGSVDFAVYDRAGYLVEEYESGDARHERATFIDRPGIEYDLVMQIYDGRTGELIREENIKDFERFGGNVNAAAVSRNFESLRLFEDRMLGTFAQRFVNVPRVLFTK